uniref:Uncharacterized protein n=1 Tax=Caenorhabditis japonica TaxID=281687 RepID=A0A8R1EV92_CAEJA
MDEFMETMDGVLEKLVEENRRTDAEAAVSGRATRGAEGQKAWRMTDESTIGTIEEELQSEDEVMSLKQRRRKIRGFAKFVATTTEVEQETRRKIALMTKCSERQKELIIEPFMKFSRELLERFEEMGGDQWTRSVLRVMREFGLETVESLREACEKAVSGSEVGTPREKLKKEVEKLSNEKTLLQEAWMEEKNMLKEQMEQLEREKNFAEECLGQLKMTRSVEKKTAEKLERSLQQCSDELEKLRQENFRRSHKEDLKPRFSQKVDCGNEHLRVKVEDWEMESRSSRSSGMREMVQCMSRMMKSSALPEPKTFDGSGEFGVVSNPLFIKRNKGIAIGSRSTTRCPPKAAQVKLDKMGEDKTRCVPRNQMRLVSDGQMGAKKGRREARRRVVNDARRSVMSKFSVENPNLTLTRTLENRHGGVYTVKPDRDRLAPTSLSASESSDSMECLVDCSDMGVTEHESVTNRRLGRSRSGKESRRGVDTLLRARARRLERHRHVSADK